MQPFFAILSFFLVKLSVFFSSCNPRMCRISENVNKIKVVQLSKILECYYSVIVQAPVTHTNTDFSDAADDPFVPVRPIRNGPVSHPQSP